MDNDKIGRYIAQKRGMLRLTQKELAQKLHVTRQTVSKWEVGKSIPDAETLLALAGLFGVSVEEILNGEENPGKVVQSVAAPVNIVPSVGIPVVQPGFYHPPAGWVPYAVYTEKAGTKAPDYPAFHSPRWWLLWIPAALAALLAALIPFGKTLYYSMTNSNMIETPHFIGLQNYVHLLGDDITRKSIGNTLLIFLLAGSAALLLGWLLGSSASRLPRPVGIITAVLLGIGSLFALTPAGLGFLFSSTAYGPLNSFLLEAGILESPVPWVLIYTNGLQILVLFLLCLGPSFLIFYMGGRVRKLPAAWHVAVTAMPLLLLAGYMAPVYITGFPSTDYSAHWLPLMVYDYGMIRFEIGTACALIVMMLDILLFILVPVHLLIWLVSRLKPVNGVTPLQRPRAYHWCGGIGGLLCGIFLQIPLFVTLSYAFRPMDEFFMYPWPVFPLKLTLQSFRELHLVMPDEGLLHWMPLYLLLALAVYAVLVLPTAAVMAFNRRRGHKVAAAIWLGIMAVSSNFIPSLYPEAINHFLPTLLLLLVASPLLPLNVLLTVWLLRKSAEGCGSFHSWFHRKKRMAYTGIALLATALSGSLSLLYQLQPFLYQELHRFPLQILSPTATRVTVYYAAQMMIHGTGIVLLVFVLISALLVERMGSKIDGTQLRR